MAREEQDREDLFAEAVALSPRLELTIIGRLEPMVVGLHRGGGLSLYVAPEEVWHFNPSGQVRRAYLAGRLLKAELGALIALDRHRSEQSVDLLREPLGEVESARLIARLADELAALRDAFKTQSIRVLRRFPDDSSAIDEVREALAALPQSIAIASRPNVSG